MLILPAGISHSPKNYYAEVSKIAADSVWFSLLVVFVTVIAVRVYSLLQRLMKLLLILYPTSNNTTSFVTTKLFIHNQ